MNEPQKYAQWKKPDTKHSICMMNTYKKYTEKANLDTESRPVDT